MPHSRQDVLRVRSELVASIDNSIALIKEHMGQMHGALGALENAKRSLSTIAGDEPLELEQPAPDKPSKFKEIAARMAAVS